MTTQTGQQIITIHILPNLLRSRGNQKMKFSHLIEYNMRNIFLKKLCKKCGKENSPRPFSIKSNLSRSLNQHSQILCGLFLY